MRNSGHAVHHRHGVRFIFYQSGMLGAFDTVALLITLVTGLGLLAVATTVVDFMMQYVLKGKDVYKAYKYHVTADADVFRGKTEDELAHAAMAYRKKLPSVIGEDSGSVQEPSSGSSSTGDNLYGDDPLLDNFEL